MASPGPLHAVRIAADIIARGLQQGHDIAEITAANPHAVGGLTAEQQEEAAGYAAGAVALGEALRESPTGTTLADLEAQGYQSAAGGVLRVTLRYDTLLPDGRIVERHQTVLVDPAGYTTFSSAEASAVAELLERQRDGKRYDRVQDPDFAEVVFEPFNLYA